MREFYGRLCCILGPVPLLVFRTLKNYVKPE